MAVLAATALFPPFDFLAGQAEGADPSFARLGADDAIPHPSSNLEDELFLGSVSDGTITRVNLTTYSQTVIVSGLVAPQDGACNAAGQLFFPETTSGRIVRFERDGSNQATVFTDPALYPEGLSFDVSDNLFFNTAYGVDGAVWTIAGGLPGNPASPATAVFATIGEGTAFDNGGDLLAVDRGGSSVTRFSPPFSGGNSGTLFASVPDGIGIALSAGGDVFVASETDGAILRYDGNGTFLGTLGSGFLGPRYMEFDSAGNLYVSDESAGNLVKITPGGTQTVIAAVSGAHGVAICRNGLSNAPPVADAGPDQQVYRNVAVILDGSGSYDPDGDPLTYRWSQVTGTPVTLNGTQSPETSFVSSEPGGLEFRLAVRDGGAGEWVGTPDWFGYGPAWPDCCSELPQVVADAAGNAMAVMVADDFVYNVWAKRYIAGIGWEPAVLIESGSGDSRNVDVTVDPSGNFIAAWRQWDGSRWTVQANRYVPGSGWEVAVPVTSDPTDAGRPQVAADAAGNAMAVWRQWDGTNWSIRASRYLAGVGWGANALLESAPGEAWDPQVAVDPAGHAMAVWHQWDGTNSSIWQNRYVPGVGWNNATLIESDPGDATSPQVGMDSAGNAMAVWQWFDGAATSIRAIRYDVATGWGIATPVESNSTDAWNPRLAVDPAGNAVAAWEGPYAIWASHYAVEVGWETPNLLHPDPGGYAAAPEVAINPAGDAVVVWQGRLGGGSLRVRAASYALGIGWGSAVPLEGYGSNLWFPQIALDPAGYATVLVLYWDEPINALDDIGAIRFHTNSSGSSDTVGVTVVNRAPVADAGSDETVTGTGSTVTLNGTGSYDPDADAITYLWSQTAGPDYPPINNATSAVAGFLPAAAGVHTFTLLITDAYGDMTSDEVNVTILIPDGPPIAVALVSPTTGFLGTPFLFDASASTDDVGITAYLWDFGDAATDANALATHAYAARGTFTVSLTVWDTTGQSDTDSLTIQVENRAPIASATATAPPIFRGQTVALDGTGSGDPDGDSLTYAWSQVSGPQGTLTGANAATASFVPTEIGAYAFNLTVDDGFGGTAVDDVTVTVVNRDPMANAGPDQPSAGKYVPISLDATASIDPDGDSLSYAWTAPPGISLSDVNDATPTFTATRSGTYVFLLRTDDGFGGTAADTVVVMVLNTRPLAVATPPTTAVRYSAVILDGSASWDADGDALAYAWSQVSGPLVLINGASAATADFTPSVSGTYVFELTVDDGDSAGTDSAQVTVSVSNALTPVNVNWKPLVAAVFAAVLTALGASSSRRRARGREGERNSATIAFATTSLPFVLAEAATGILSYFTGSLSIPPLLGIGTFVDGGILAAGFAVAVLRARGPGAVGTPAAENS